MVMKWTPDMWKAFKAAWPIAADEGITREELKKSIEWASGQPKAIRGTEVRELLIAALERLAKGETR
jgi:hypothetical protein